MLYMRKSENIRTFPRECQKNSKFSLLNLEKAICRKLFSVWIFQSSYTCSPSTSDTNRRQKAEKCEARRLYNESIYRKQPSIRINNKLREIGLDATIKQFSAN